MADSTATLPLDAASAARQRSVKRHVRGSSLLLGGRFVAKGMNFAVQILIVRYLSQSDYGALAYALSIVAVGEAMAKFGMQQAITRYLPIYQVQQRYNALFGTMFIAAGVVLSLGLAIALLPYAILGFLGRPLIGDTQAWSLLLVLIFLVPVQVFDQLLISVFAVFSSPRLIFLRKHVLGPGLKLLVVGLLIFGRHSVFFLAIGHLAVAVVGLAICGGTLFQLLYRRGLFEHFRLGSLTVPWREIFLFAIPLLTTDLVYVVMHAINAVVLESCGGVSEIAGLRAVYRLAVMNHVVMSSFATLFTPMASRMFARRNHEGINALYWQTAVWIAVLSFPIFALTFSLAGPLTVLFYGARYEGSAIVLSLLSLGYFFDSALGPNAHALKVYGKVRYIATINIATALFSLVVALLLVPHYGAVGAAMTSSIALIAHNMLKQAGLRFGTGIKLFEWRYTNVYLTIVAAAAVCWTVQTLVSPPPYVGLALAAIVSLAVVRLNRQVLQAEQIFPELLRFPLARWFVGRQEPAD